MKKAIIMLCLLEISFSLQAQKKAFQTDVLNVTGYGQVIYYAGEDRNSIDMARAVITASGKLGFENRLNYTLMYDFVPNKLLELYGEWGFSQAAQLRFGQFKMPFSLENPMSSTRIETIYGSRVLSEMKIGRDAGLQVRGSLLPKADFNQLEYYAGVFNGNGINVKDSNKRKDVVGTVYYQPVKGLRIGGSVYSGDDNRWAASAEYQRAKWLGRAEYIYSKLNGIERFGNYVLLVYKLVPDKWEILAKEAYYTPNSSIGNNGITDWTAGVNYYLDNLTRLQLNYIYTDDPVNGNNHAVLTQLQLYF